MWRNLVGHDGSLVVGVPKEITIGETLVGYGGTLVEWVAIAER